jgi:hypothetical protein
MPPRLSGYRRLPPKMYESPLAIRMEARGPRRPMDAEKRPLRTPKLGPDLESPTHRPRPSDLRRENRKGIGRRVTQLG